jgi:hypothetical protein
LLHEAFLGLDPRGLFREAFREAAQGAGVGQDAGPEHFDLMMDAISEMHNKGGGREGREGRQANKGPYLRHNKFDECLVDGAYSRGPDERAEGAELL